MTHPAPTDTAPGRDRHWGLFADRCTATDHTALPAAPDTVLAFLAELPAGPVTTLRRIHAVDHAHHAAGLTPPGADPAFDHLLRPDRPPRFEPALVAAALQAIPVGGWPTGIVGRRDAALVAVICTAGLTRRQTQALRYNPRSDHPQGNTVPVMATSPHPGACPACAVTRWQRVAAALDTVGWRAVRHELADLGENPASTETVHDCARPVTYSSGGRSGSPGRRSPLFPAIDRHGAPQPTYPLSTRSVTAIITTRLAAPPPPTDGWDSPDAAGHIIRRPWGEADRARMRAERQKAKDRLAGYETLLDQADAYAEAALQRLAVGLGDTAEFDPSD